ncbi:MAG: FecR domain-containing protein [Mojavia pulchra JT2-VF2]|jgi:acrosin|uniref:FecR domain-containing protein n=1 Tax=Mojavia pulchra JT2-VF2 TaxID=287848 RepID=A0A951PSW1_9NOST|nr:FecR domain-containing protein [Mojavia pulchra JT2-VF2]
MFHKLFPLLMIGLWGVIVFPLPEQASAITPLTRAQIQDLRNLVQLIPRNSQKKRPARKLDAMIPGDGLSTGRASLADLRFNDGSLARVGEQAVFQFLPKTRNLRLSNGTVLLLIPPGRGQTRIQTPNAAAAIRGSALFVRYDQKTDTTIVGALTNSGIEVSNKEASQRQLLEAGQLIIIIKGRFQGLYDFDLRNFYETSDIVRGLDLTKQNLTPTPDPAIASVQAETAASVATQTPIKGEGVIENPSFLQLTASSSNLPDNNINQDDSSLRPIKENLLEDSFVGTGEVLLNDQPETANNNGTIRNTNNTGADTSQTSTSPQITVPTPSATITLPKPDNELPKPIPTPELPKPDNELPKPIPTPELPKPDNELPKPIPTPELPKPDNELPKPIPTPELPKPDNELPKPIPTPELPKPDNELPKPIPTPELPKPDNELPKPIPTPELPKPDNELPKPIPTPEPIPTPTPEPPERPTT